MLHIINGRVINPAENRDGIYDIFIENERITEVAEHIAPREGERVIDASGMLIFPGFIDLHVHFRDPGQTHKEDILTGSAAAAHGGFTTVCAMPNTTPVVDCAKQVRYVLKKGKEAGLCRVLPVGCVTKGMAGEELSDMEAMIEAGIPAFSEDGKSVMNAGLLRKAMRIMAKHDIPMLDHCEDATLVEGGVANCDAARRLHIPGISNAVENAIASRDIMLAQETGARLHLCHCSTKESVELIARAKEKGYAVSGEVCPHHFTLCDTDILSADDANYKMNPPLRAREDVEALKEGLKNGIIEAISTDHAPHTAEEKAKGFLGSPFGIVGLETAAALAYTELVETGLLTEMQLAERMSASPAKILGLDLGDISVGKTADLTIFDPRECYEIHAADFRGRSKNMPYEGRKVKGKVKYTIFKGECSYDSETDQ